MKTHLISVTVGSNAIQVQPDTLTMTSLDEVRWAGTNAGKFTVRFEGAGPFNQPALAYDLAISARRPLVNGMFKYSIVSDANPGLVLDPVIIVEEPPTYKNP